MVQRTRVIKTRKKHSGESSPYWDWVNNRLAKSSGDKARQWQYDGEVPLSNPDMLSEEQGLRFEPSPAAAEVAGLIKEAMHLLSDQQRAVVEMMAEGKSTREAARALGMNTSTLANHLKRARKKIHAYVTQNAE